MMAGKKSQRSITSALFYILYILVALIFIAPLLFLFLSAMKEEMVLVSDMATMRAFIPNGRMSFDNYIAVFEKLDFFHYFRNTLLNALIQVVIGMFINGMMGYANLEGIAGAVECVIFPRTLTLYGRYFHDDAPVLVKGRLNIREDRVNSLLIEELADLEGASKKLFIRLPVLSDSPKVQRIIQNYPGGTPIVLVDAKRQAKAAPRDWNVKLDEELLSTLQAVFGKENVIVK